ncbi:class II histocompatibility antigen, B-L beta chain-like [Corvus kubaryi]|uniref:class II histocompatibility antigen, B-L beta chain-like n=1 Tax=Corvus kubaryi TaxID=68294 RepID=UPI001C048631|nr:class II histocompatibility antigen, B-L beta chain-like [Corvus kubaryi]
MGLVGVHRFWDIPTGGGCPSIAAAPALRQPSANQRTLAQVHRLCRHSLEVSTPFLVGRRVPPSVSISLVPSSSQPGPGRLLCSGMDFYPAQVQLRWFQGWPELLGHVVATDIGGAGNSPKQPPQMALDTAHSKMLTGIGGFTLGFVFLALGLGFYLCKQSS